MSFFNSADVSYKRLIEDVLLDGETVVTRNSKVRRIFGETIRFNKTPLVTTRKTSWKNALREWEWFLSGSMNIEDLHPSVSLWWEPWANAEGDIVSNYGKQFRDFAGHFSHVDSVETLVNGITLHPFSRRNVITTWNTADMMDPSCQLTNCHGTVIQTFVNPDDSLHLLMYQRSVDVIVGLPHNFIQYWAFLLWLCHRTNKKIGTFTWIGGDIHVYDVHNELAMRIISTSPQEDPPELVYNPSNGNKIFRADDFSLNGSYAPSLLDKAEMVV